MNPNLVNGIAEALRAKWNLWPADALRIGDDAAKAAIAFVAALPHDYTAADVLAEMRGDAP